MMMPLLVLKSGFMERKRFRLKFFTYSCTHWNGAYSTTTFSALGSQTRGSNKVHIADCEVRRFNLLRAFLHKLDELCADPILTIPCCSQVRYPWPRMC